MKVTTEVYGFEGTGPTLKAAREDAQKQCRIAMTGTYRPCAHYWRGYLAIMTRKPHGWGYRMVDVNSMVDGDHVDIDHCSAFQAEATQEAVWDSMLRHLAQIGQRIEDEEAPEFITERHDREEFKRRRRFMIGCKAAQDAGKSGPEIHAAGCAAMTA